jgi:hypothetical protein
MSCWYYWWQTIGKGKGKTKFSLRFLLTEHHASEAYWWIGRMTPRTLEFGTRWRTVVSFTLWPLYSHGKRPWYPLERRLVGHQNWPGRGDEEKISQPLPGLEPPIIQPVAQLYTTELSRFRQTLGTNYNCHIEFHKIGCLEPMTEDRNLQKGQTDGQTHRRNFSSLIGIRKWRTLKIRSIWSGLCEGVCNLSCHPFPLSNSWINWLIIMDLCHSVVTIWLNSYIKQFQYGRHPSYRNTTKCLIHVLGNFYEGVSKRFRTESQRNIHLPLVLLVEKQHKTSWRQNSLAWLTK